MAPWFGWPEFGAGDGPGRRKPMTKAGHRCVLCQAMGERNGICDVCWAKIQSGETVRGSDVSHWTVTDWLVVVLTIGAFGTGLLVLLAGIFYDFIRVLR